MCPAYSRRKRAKRFFCARIRFTWGLSVSHRVWREGQKSCVRMQACKNTCPINRNTCGVCIRSATAGHISMALVHLAGAEHSHDSVSYIHIFIYYICTHHVINTIYKVCTHVACGGRATDDRLISLNKHIIFAVRKLHAHMNLGWCFLCNTNRVRATLLS